MTSSNVVKRTTFAPRFFVFLTIGLSIIGWIIYGIVQNISPPKVEWGNLNSSFSAEAVIVRNEQIVTSTNYGTLECLTAEGEFTYEGTAVAKLYLSDYSENDIESLISKQQEIKTYQTINILKNINYPDLEEINDKIDALIDEISALAMENRNREIPAKDSELKVLMEERRRYMNENLPADADLEKYYMQEADMLEKINNSIITMYAPRDGIVSFFLDGMETYLDYNFLQNMSSNEFDSMMKVIDENYSSANLGLDSKININQTVYRIVEPNLWYAVMKVPRNKNTLVTGQSYFVNFEGYEYGAVNGYVEFMVDAGKDLIIVMQFTEDIGTMATLRIVTCNFGDSSEGYRIKREYIEYVDGVYGVNVRDGGKKFVPVNVLAQDNTHVIVSSADEDNPLIIGQRLVKPG
ncbi:MAG: HlyD family efflux transporter periplasmic adaptor subunit [Eubacteriales bacterium]